MPYATEQKYLALGKESVRGTAVTPSRYIPVGKDTELDYKLELVEDAQVRALLERFPAKAGRLVGVGRISNLEIAPDMAGELIYSLLNKVATTHSGTLAYLHKFTKDSTVLQNQSYTIHIGRGLNTKMYNLGVVKSMAFKGTGDGKVTADADVLFQQEAAETFSPSPSWASQLTPLMFYNTKLTFDVTDDTTTIKDWNLTIDNQAFAKWVLNQKQYCTDILCSGKLQVSGGFTAYFEDETRRGDFLAGTSQKLVITCTGDLIETSNYNELIFTLPKVIYKAYPFGDVDGLLGAAVTFDAYYDLSSSETIDIQLQNTNTSY